MTSNVSSGLMGKEDDKEDSKKEKLVKRFSFYRGVLLGWTFGVLQDKIKANSV